MSQEEIDLSNQLYKLDINKEDKVEVNNSAVVNNNNDNENKNENENIIYTQSQSHGFKYENEIRKDVFGLDENKNSTTKHDISCQENKFDPNENISIKMTGSNNIDCADILNFHDSDEDSKLTMIVIQYKQIEDYKIIKNIYEINYNKNMRDLLFGTVTRAELECYVNFVKNIPKGKVSKESRDQYIKEKKNLQKQHNMLINISPKCDRYNQRRVQCSIRNFESLLKDFITYKSLDESPNILRGVALSEKIYSEKRKRNKKF